jgi:hypothetical protein
MLEPHDWHNPAAFEAIRHGFHSATLASSMIPTTKRARDLAEPRALDRLEAMRGPGESYSDGGDRGLNDN